MAPVIDQSPDSNCKEPTCKKIFFILFAEEQICWFYEPQKAKMTKINHCWHSLWLFVTDMSRTNLDFPTIQNYN